MRHPLLPEGAWKGKRVCLVWSLLECGPCSSSAVGLFTYVSWDDFYQFQGVSEPNLPKTSAEDGRIDGTILLRICRWEDHISCNYIVFPKRESL